MTHEKMAKSNNEKKSLTLAQQVISAMIAALSPLMEFDAGSPQPRLEQGDNEDAVAFLARLTAALEEHKVTNAGKAIAFHSAIMDAVKPALALIPSAPTTAKRDGVKYGATHKEAVWKLLKAGNVSASGIETQTGVKQQTIQNWKREWDFANSGPGCTLDKALGRTAAAVTA